MSTPETFTPSAGANSETTELPDHLSAPAPHPDNPPWGVWSALLTWCASVALIFIIPNLCILPYVAYRYRGTRGLTEQILVADKTLVLIFILASLPVHAITLAMVWAVATKLGKFSFRKVFGWRWTARFGPWKCIGLGASLFFAAWVILIVFKAKPTDLDKILQSSRPAALVLAFLAVATAPLVEEVTYRGLLYSALQRVTGRLAAVLIVASMFAALHVWQYRQSLSVILSISLLSVVLTVVRARSGQLLPCFVIHLVFNGVQSILIVIDPYMQSLYELWRHDATTAALYILKVIT